ncbi:unnamed protein product [Protopolystoma xenopodis]|uniref:Uncharacterized protein n=1 Tax=Protopolystoma xenopodis TaxID=117903 RepID=A0A3S5CDH7_9PLAT|nr:unnamed protein product [Protopolystoma xenopodis]
MRLKDFHGSLVLMKKQVLLQVRSGCAVRCWHVQARRMADLVESMKNSQTLTKVILSSRSTERLPGLSGRGLILSPPFHDLTPSSSQGSDKSEITSGRQAKLRIRRLRGWDRVAIASEGMSTLHHPFHLESRWLLICRLLGQHRHNPAPRAVPSEASSPIVEC